MADTHWGLTLCFYKYLPHLHMLQHTLCGHALGTTQLVKNYRVLLYRYKKTISMIPTNSMSSKQIC